jgi:hypothetical protein
MEHGELPAAALKAKTYTSIEKDLVDWVYTNHSIEVSYSPLLDAYSNPGEPLDKFKARIAQTAREQRDAAIEELRAKSGKALKSLQEKITKIYDKMEAEKAQASSAKLKTVMAIGGSILGALFGRKSGMSAVGSLVKGTTITAASQAWKEGKDVAATEADLERLKLEYDQLNKETEDQVQKIRDQYESSSLVVETQKITPKKKDIQPTQVGILWLPYERSGEKLRKAWEV